MRTTIDLPEDLLRRAKSTAALRGIKMKDLIAEFIRRGLSDTAKLDPTPKGIGRSLPVMIPAAGRNIPVMTNAQIFEILDGEDDAAHGRLS